MMSFRIFLTALAEVLTFECVKSFYRTRYFEKHAISCVSVRKLGENHSNNGGDIGESVGKKTLYFFQFLMC